MSATKTGADLREPENNSGLLKRVLRLLDQLAACEKLTARMRINAAVIVGNEMRNVRQSRNISLREMARRLGLSAAFISDLERGRRGWNERRIQEWMNHIK